MTVTMSTPSPSILERPETDVMVADDAPWKVIVWNDPVNTMDYVVFVFQKLFGYSKGKATQLMYEVHNEGKSVVASGPRETAEMHAYHLHEYGLWATIEQDK